MKEFLIFVKCISENDISHRHVKDRKRTERTEAGREQYLQIRHAHADDIDKKNPPAGFPRERMVKRQQFQYRQRDNNAQVGGNVP